jgi:PAS domain S-box-containing protein
MFESLLEASRAGVGFVDRGLRYVRVNRQLALLNGVPAAAHPGRTIREVIPFAAAEVEPMVQRVFDTGEPVRDHTLEIPGPEGGEPTYLAATFFPVHDSAQAVRWVGVVVDNVSAEERAVHALRLSEERFRLAAKAARDVVWDWDLLRDCVTTVGGVGRVFGFGNEEVGDTPEWWVEQIHPDDRARVLDSIRAAVESGELWSEEYRHRRADGAYAVVMDRAYVARDGKGRAVRMVGVTTDVTLERTAAQALARSEARFRSVFESPMIGIGFWGDGRVWEANDALLSLLGYTRDELDAGMIVSERLTPPDQRARDLAAQRELTERGAVTPYEKQFLRRDGTRIPVVVGGSPYPAPPVTGVFFVLDNSELGRMREQAQAAQRMEMVGQLAGGVAHEVNNALQGVMGFSDFVLRSLARGHVNHEDVEQIRRSAERGARITQQLLAFSRRQLLRPMALDLNLVVSEFLPMVRQALGPAHALAVIPSTEPVLVDADRGQLEQVLMNLVLNSRDAMAAGGEVRLRVLAAELGARELAGVTDAPPPGRYGVIEVIDNGDGMDDAVRRRIFEPFFTTKPLGSGTGLGLAVVYGIVRQSGGLVTCESAPGAGARFRVHLPISAAAVATAVPPV